MKLSFKVVQKSVSFSAPKHCRSALRVRWNPAPYQVSPVNQSHHLYQKHGRYVWELSVANSAASSAANSAANSANWRTVDCSSSNMRWMYLYLYNSRCEFMLITAALPTKSWTQKSWNTVCEA